VWREGLRLGGAVVLVVGGLGCIVVALQTNVEAHNTRRGWVESDAEQRAATAVSQPTPIWLPDGAIPVATPVRVPLTVLALSTPAVPGVTAGTTELIDSGFMFLDPPQPGARARFWLNLHTNGGQSGGPIALAIPLAWFDGYRVASTTPSASIDVTTDDGRRRLVFGTLAPGAATLQVDVVSTAEGVAPPSVRVELAVSGTTIGEAHPRTVAPRPRPGPISAVRIPRLSLNIAVVPTDWEPPAFVAGQLRASANVGQGNSVLVGHLTGAAGAVFNHLDELSPGDTIVAVSRGLEYTFVVSDKQTLPADESGPAAPDTRPRLTLMTCTGTWDPLARNYSDRLWVTAEPRPATVHTP